MIIFGGYNQGNVGGGGHFSDTWIFDIEKKEWKEIKPNGIEDTENKVKK